MAKPKGARSGSSKSRGGAASINAIKTFKDTLQEGSVDEFMHQRDKITLGDDHDEPGQAAGPDDEDILADRGQEVFSLNLPKGRDAEEAYDEAYDDEEEDVAPVKKGRKTKVKPDVSTKGRYGKSDTESSDEEAASSDDPDAESWGRSYYSRPSTRRGREMEEENSDEEKEEERMLEEKEVRRLQRKMRSVIDGDEDWGFDELEAGPSKDIEEAATRTSKSILPPPTTSLPASTPTPQLLTHLTYKEPVKLALARDFPLIVKRLEKTERGIKKMQQDEKAAAEEEEEGPNGPLHQGLAWLHYQTLLSYATTLAFYLHLASLPSDKRPDFTTHPILPRLLQMKEAVSAMEDADFAAASDDEGDLIELYDGEEETDDDEDGPETPEEKAALKKALKQLLSGQGQEVDWEDAEDTWEGGDLEDGELEGLQADAGDLLSEEDSGDEEDDGELDEDDEDLDLGDDLDLDDEEGLSDDFEDEEEEIEPVSTKKSKKDSKKSGKPALLEEPDFVPASKSGKRSSGQKSMFDDEDMGDLTELSASEQAERSAKKRSLRFHTSKIAATSARRAAAREARLQGDEDVPYKNRQAARDAALQRNSARGTEGEDLDGQDWSDKDKKRAREAMDQDDGDDYYETVKRRRTDEKEAKQQAHDQAREEQRRALTEPETSDGPRSLTRAIEKNRGLTPRRAKANRNPRVKKRESYEKAKRKVKSMRAVYSGGQGALGGAYQGEKTGISTTSKSRRF